MKDICSIDGCERPRYGRGWCALHWKRWWRHGDPMQTFDRRNPGEGTISHGGYLIHCRNQKNTREHIEIIERFLGRPLRGNEEVHHLNENKLDNRIENLLLCPDRAYHMLLHQRIRAQKACGNPEWRKCVFCKQYDDPSGMKKLNTGVRYHPACRNEYRRNHPERKRVQS